TGAKAPAPRHPFLTKRQPLSRLKPLAQHPADQSTPLFLRPTSWRQIRSENTERSMFDSMKVAFRLALLAGVLILLMLVIGVMGIQGMREAQNSMKTVYDDRVIPMRDLKIIIDNYALLLVDNPQKTIRGLADIQQVAQTTRELQPQ